MVSPVFKIIPTTQQYDWGRIGLASKVAQFASESKLPGFELQESAPYAELWMGTHPKSPSLLPFSKEPLGSYLSAHPSLIGQSIIAKYPDAASGNLPFLFKVLAIQKALSIQTHPDKKTAEILHAQLPDIYKDPNHKPEMALALTPFQALCGFLPLPIIATYLTTTPEFSSLIPLSISTKFVSISSSATPTGPEEKAALKDLFAALMTAEEAAVKEAAESLIMRYRSAIIAEKEKPIKDLVLKLNADFPGDIGIFCVFMLNYVHLQPGEAIFLGAGEPHAYVSGDIMECMANSDNVIRAGLTPKLRDIPNLVSGLTYTAADPTNHVVQPASFRSSTSVSTLYDPPIPEFSVIQLRLPRGKKETHPAIEGPSVAIVTEGKGVVEWGGDNDKLDVGTGDVFFIGAGTEVSFTAAGGERVLVVYRAFVEAN